FISVRMAGLRIRLSQLPIWTRPALRAAFIGLDCTGAPPCAGWALSGTRYTFGPRHRRQPPKPESRKSKATSVEGRGLKRYLAPTQDRDRPASHSPLRVLRAPRVHHHVQGRQEGIRVDARESPSIQDWVTPLLGRHRTPSVNPSLETQTKRFSPGT